MSFFKRRKSGRPYDIFSSYDYFTAGFKETFILFLLFLVGTLMGVGITAVFTLLTNPEYSVTYGNLIAYPVMFLPAMLYASAKSRKNELFESGFRTDNDNFGNKGGTVMAFAVSVATLAASFLLSSLTEFLPPMPERLEKAMEMMMDGPIWATLLSVSVMAPFFEELLCRGLILRGLLQKTSPAWAITVSSLFFALLHANIWQGIPAFGMGLLFGLVYYRTGSLKLTMLMHCVNNTAAVIMSNIDSLKDVDSLREVMSPWAFTLCAAAWVIIIFCLCLILRGIPVKDRSGCERLS